MVLCLKVRYLSLEFLLLLGGLLCRGLGCSLRWSSKRILLNDRHSLELVHHHAHLILDLLEPLIGLLWYLTLAWACIRSSLWTSLLGSIEFFSQRFDLVFMFLFQVANILLMRRFALMHLVCHILQFFPSLVELFIHFFEVSVFGRVLRLVFS